MGTIIDDGKGVYMIVCAVTGASGPIMGIMLMEELLKGVRLLQDRIKRQPEIMEHELSAHIRGSL
jgi:3-polyprenyl-4-hydroxybenzoate decarboxylase